MNHYHVSIQDPVYYPGIIRERFRVQEREKSRVHNRDIQGPQEIRGISSEWNMSGDVVLIYML